MSIDVLCSCSHSLSNYKLFFEIFSLNRNVNIVLPLIKCMTVCIKANLKTKQCYDNTMIWNQNWTKS